MSAITTKQYRLLFPEHRLIDVEQILKNKLDSGLASDAVITSLVCFFIFDAKLMKSQERFLSELIRVKSNTTQPSTLEVWYLIKLLIEGKWWLDYDIVRIGEKHDFIRSY